jgi:hypothetical protein
MKTFKGNFYLFSIFICIILIAYAIYVFPIPGTDSIVFIPAALLSSKGYGLANPLYPITKLTDLTHTNRFNYYVPFYPFLLGLLSRISPGVKTIFFFCALFSSANLLLYAKVISSFLPKAPGIALKATILLSVSYIGIYLLPTVGRPENFTSLFSFLICILYHKKNEIGSIKYNIVACILFALILSSQIICFYFCFLIYALYDIINAENIYRAIIKNIAFFLCILILFCLILQKTPNGLVNTISGIMLHVKYVMNRADRSIPTFIYFWLLAPLNLGFLVIFLLAASLFVKEIYARLRIVPTDKIVVSITIIILIVMGIAKFILYASPTVYNATEFIIPLSAYIIYNMINIRKANWKKGLFIFSIITFTAGSLFFVRNLVLFMATLQSGKDYDTAKTLINKLTEKNKNVYITNGLWSLFDNIDKITVYNEVNVKSGDTIIVQQANNVFPKSLTNKCEVIYDWGISEEAKFMGIRIANRPHGYSFVICRVK